MSAPLLATLCLAGTPPAGTAAAADRPPNVLFVFADDWGWGDLGCHGHPDLKTPRLDRLAAGGTDFRQFLVCSPVCSSSRAAVVSGRYPARLGVHQHFAGHDSNVARGMPDFLPPEDAVLPRLLHAAGYATGHYGKWHLSGGGADIDAPLPAAYGFDDAAVFVGPGRQLFDGVGLDELAGDAHDPVAASFLTTAATEHALRFLRETHAADPARPFFVNLWVHETHHLVSATAEDKAAYPDTPEPQRTYYAAVTRADRQIGRVLDLLDELGVADDTLVIFSSDNGPEHSQPGPTDKLYHSVGVTGGLRGRKRSLYLGGVNVPFLVRWPGVVPAGRVDDETVFTAVDLAPTLLRAAGVDLPKGYATDGFDVGPAWRGEPWTRPAPVFWEWRGTHAREPDWPTHAVRDGRFVLLRDEPGARVELYDVRADRGQTRDLAARRPAVAADLSAKLAAWRSTLPPFVQAPGGRAPRRGGPTGTGPCGRVRSVGRGPGRFPLARRVRRRPPRQPGRPPPLRPLRRRRGRGGLAGGVRRRMKPDRGGWRGPRRGPRRSLTRVVAAVPGGRASHPRGRPRGKWSLLFWAPAAAVPATRRLTHRHVEEPARVPAPVRRRPRLRPC